jgi:hypothetical protein
MGPPLRVALAVAWLVALASPPAHASDAAIAGAPAPGLAAPTAGAGAWRAVAEGFEAEPPAPTPPPGTVSEFALAAPLVEEGLIAQRGMTRPPKKPKVEPPAVADSAAAPAAPASRAERPRRPRRMGRVQSALSGERARVMLQSLTVPGWGQASLGQRRTALAFGLLEAGVWASFTAFRVQEHMRRETYERTARLFGGIDLSGRDEEYRRVVGLYLSSEDYNRLVVRRDAANLYYDDRAAYDAYIAAHEIKGADAWSWGSEEDFLRYRTERQNAQRAAKHAQDALAAAIVNRLLSVIHASRSHARPAPDRTSWRVECAPAGGEPGAFRLALRADF